jgi:hypothetical protein
MRLAWKWKRTPDKYFTIVAGFVMDGFAASHDWNWDTKMLSMELSSHGEISFCWQKSSQCCWADAY